MLTKTRVTVVAASACAMECASSGFPAKSRIFLCGTDTEPDLAGMMARTWMVGSTYGRIGSEIVGASVVEVVETSVTSRTTRSRRSKRVKAGKQRCKVIFQYSKWFRERRAKAQLQGWSQRQCTVSILTMARVGFSCAVFLLTGHFQ